MSCQKEGLVLKKHLSIISLIAYIYIALAAGLCNLLPLTESVKSIIAQPTIILIPYLVGKPFLYFTKKLISIDALNDFVVDAAVSWSLGIVFMVTLEAALYVNYLFTLDSFIMILLVISLLSVFIKEKSDFKNLKNVELTMAVLYGIVFSFFVTRFWPYPYTNDNDYISHTFFVTRIVIQNRPLLFYNDYLPTMHTVYAVAMRLMNISPYKEPLYLLWASRFIIYPIFSVGLYLFTHQFFKNKLMALIAACIGTSLMSFFNGCIFPYHTAPKNFVDLMIIYGLYAALNLYQQNEKSKGNGLAPFFGFAFVIALVFIPLYLTGVNGAIGYEIGFILPLMLVLILALPWFMPVEQRNVFLSISLIVTELIFMAKLQGLANAVVVVAFLFFIWLLNKASLNRARLLAILVSGTVLLLFILVYFKVIPYPSLPFMRPNDQDIGLYGIKNVLRNFGSIYPLILVFLFLAVPYSPSPRLMSKSVVFYPPSPWHHLSCLPTSCPSIWLSASSGAPTPSS